MDYRFTVESMNFQKAGLASGKVKEILQRIGYHPNTVRRAAIITYELEMNLVIHGGGGQLSVSVSPEAIEVTATDGGPGIPDIELALQEGYSTAPPQVREMGFGAGMGLPNIKRCADELSIQSKVNQGTTVRAKIVGAVKRGDL